MLKLVLVVAAFVFLVSSWILKRGSKLEEFSDRKELLLEASEGYLWYSRRLLLLAVVVSFI